MYESSMLCPFGADDDELTASGFTIVVAGLEATIVVETAGLGFDFGAFISRLTRTDAGT